MDNSTYFKKLAAPVLFFALIFSILTENINVYHAPKGIIAYTVLIIFIHFAGYSLNKPFRYSSLVFDTFILGFAISNYFTASLYKVFIFFNNVSLFVCTVSALICLFYDDKNWSFGKQLRVFFSTLLSSLKILSSPFRDLSESKSEETSAKAKHIFIAILITLPTLIVLTVLLCNADAIFRTITTKLLDNINFFRSIGIIFHTVILFFALYCGIKVLNSGKAAGIEEQPSPNVDYIIGAIITGSVSVLYLLFSLVQIFGLFAGNMKLPAEYTYAEYAREGFFSLLTVCVINLVIVLICRWFFEDKRLITILLLIICASTYIMLASSVFKLSMYVSAYTFTALRFSAYMGMIVIFFLLTGIVVSIFKKSFPLYKYGLFTILTGYLALSACQVDYWVDYLNRTMF